MRYLNDRHNVSSLVSYLRLLTYVHLLRVRVRVRVRVHVSPRAWKEKRKYSSVHQTDPRFFVILGRDTRVCSDKVYRWGTVDSAGTSSRRRPSVRPVRPSVRPFFSFGLFSDNGGRERARARARKL